MKEGKYKLRWDRICIVIALIVFWIAVIFGFSLTSNMEWKMKEVSCYDTHNSFSYEGW